MINELMEVWNQLAQVTWNVSWNLLIPECHILKSVKANNSCLFFIGISTCMLR